MKRFNTDFTDNSYFNIIKSSVEGIYGRTFDLRKFEFNFLVDDSVNGSAYYEKNGNYDFLEINTGTIIKVVAWVKTAFAQKNILSNFGNANEEKNVVYTGEYTYKNNKHELTFSAQDEIVDLCREKLSFFVALMAIRFIVTHEIGHIVNGHTRLMRDMYMNSKIDMCMEKSNNNVQYCLDRRTLEMDADAAAATQSIDNIVTIYEQCKGMLEDMGIFNVKDLLELWGFSVACVFLLFELQLKTSYDSNSYYLPNDARYLLVIDAARQTLLSYNRNEVMSYIVDVKLYDRAVTKGLIEAEKLFQLSGEALMLSKSLIKNGEQFVQFSSELNDNWDKNIRLHLEKYARTVLFSEEETEQAIKDMKKKEETKISLKKIIYTIFRRLIKDR